MWRLAIENVVRYSIEAAVLIAVGAAFAWTLRTSDARLRLLHWQFLLVGCLLLPLAGRWHAPLIFQESAQVDVVERVTSAVPVQPAFSVSWQQLAVIILLAGAALMLFRLVLGAIRLYVFRQRATPVQLGTCGVEVRISGDVSGPVSYGFLRPIILLPADFHKWTEEARQCVLAHEIAHVNRRDWIFGILEELVRAVLWFHPGVWVVINRIHLSREQVVDAQTLHATGDREVYLDTLLSVAGLKERLGFVPAPLFVRKRHLAKRVAHLVQEIRPMKPIRMMLSLAAGTLTLIGTGALLTTLFPFEAPAQEVTINAEARGAKILHRVPPTYPPEAKLRRIEGTVSVEVTIDSKGLVNDARVLSGPDELRRAALQSVLRWQFTGTGSPNRATVELSFKLSKDSPGVVGVLKSIDLSAVPEPLRAAVAARIPLKEGDPLPMDGVKEVQLAISDLDSRLRVSLAEDMVLRAAYLSPDAIRVGGNMQSSKLVKQPRPAYPPEAKAARIQGTVRMTARIDKTGKVIDLQLEAGHPLLVPSAMEAVKQWEYQPTLLNGNPVEVITQIDVNYTLSQ